MIIQGFVFEMRSEINEFDHRLYYKSLYYHDLSLFFRGVRISLKLSCCGRGDTPRKLMRILGCKPNPLLW